MSVSVPRLLHGVPAERPRERLPPRPGAQLVRVVRRPGMPGVARPGHPGGGVPVGEVDDHPHRRAGGDGEVGPAELVAGGGVVAHGVDHRAAARHPDRGRVDQPAHRLGHRVPAEHRVLQAQLVHVAPGPVPGVLAHRVGQLVAGGDQRLAQDLVAALDDVDRRAVVPPGVLRVLEQGLDHPQPPGPAVGRLGRRQVVGEGQLQQRRPHGVEVGGARGVGVRGEALGGPGPQHVDGLGDEVVVDVDLEQRRDEHGAEGARVVGHDRVHRGDVERLVRRPGAARSSWRMRAAR